MSKVSKHEKAAVRRVPRLQTLDQKRCLNKHFQHLFWRELITVDETWEHQKI